MLLIMLIVLIGCAKGDNEPTTNSIKEMKCTYIELPDTLFGINYCNLTLKELYKKVLNLKKGFIATDCEGNKISHVTQHMIESEYALCFSSQEFIGEGLNTSYIRKVHYSFVPTYKAVQIEIELEEIYFNELYTILIAKFGLENVCDAGGGLQGIQWAADPDVNTKTCLSYVALSRNRMYSPPKTNVFYLTIETRGTYEYH